MNKVAIVADSIACLTSEMVAQHGIRIVPVNIHFNGTVYRDLVDVSPSQAYQFLERDPDHFATSAPSPTDYLQAYHALSNGAESILCITLSEKFSMLHDSALMAQRQAAEELPKTVIKVLDSHTAAGAEGLMVLAAARAAAEGKGLAEVIEEAVRVGQHMSLYAVMETIRHAYRSGRIPKVAAHIGSAFSVKPIFTISDGEARFIGIARNKRQGVNRIVKTMRDKVEGRKAHVAVMHADALDEAQELKERVASEFDCEELWISEFSPVMGYTTGRGLLGLAFYTD